MIPVNKQAAPSGGAFGDTAYFVDFEISSFSAFYLNGSEALVSGAGEAMAEGGFRLFPNPAGAAVWLDLERGRDARPYGPTTCKGS